MTIAVQPEDIERRRTERARRLAVFEIPLIRVAGSAILSIAVFLHNRYLLADAPQTTWLTIATLLFAYSIVAWIVVVALYRREPPIDLTVFFFAGDLVIWTFAVYASGAERSWLFFILLMRVADQVQTTVRRCLLFAAFATACWVAMIGWVTFVDGRPVSPTATLVKTVFILLSGIYISLAARTAEQRRAQLTSAIRMSRDLIRQLEQQSYELRDARARAEEASDAKSEFLANMSHEMRTPLHGVIGMLQLSMEDEESPQRLRRLDMAKRSAQSLLATIDDILDFSKIEARKIDLEPVYFSIREMLADTMKSLGVNAAARGLILAYYVEPDVPDTLWGDPLRLRQVIVNLVGNSIKFTPTGEITMRVSRPIDNESLIRFEVRDTGIGIDASMRDKIFQPFTQADSQARRAGGTGLGLAIVARLVEAMNGSVSVVSQPGRGSSFVFAVIMPADPMGVAPRRASWESELTGKAVLVVEANDTTRTYLALMLRSRGMFATACASADEVPEGRYACVVTSDPTLPIEPRVLVSSPLKHDDDESVRITRPVSERELIEAVGMATGIVPKPISYTLERRPVRRGMRVLLAEDNLVGQEFAAESLRRLGHDVDIASDGEEALAKIASEEFDVVLMDVQMPILDGTEVVKRYRANGGETPIVALTAHTTREARELCLEAGMNAVLTKPIDMKQLADVLMGVTGAEAIVDAVGGSARLLARVSEVFARQTPPLIASMHDAIERHDADALYRAAHKLKGSVANFNDNVCTKLALDVENAGRDRDVERAASVMPRLEEAVATLSRRIAAASANLRSVRS